MLLAALFTAVVAGGGPQHAVVLLIDDLGYGDTHHMGAEYLTPNIDVSNLFISSRSLLRFSNCRTLHVRVPYRTL